MATNYEITSSGSVDEQVSPTELISVFEVSARAIPSGVIYHVRFPPAINDPESIAAILGARADELNDISTTPGVREISVVQDFNASDQVQDRLVLEIDSTDGVLKITRDDIPFQWYPARLKAAIAETRAQLDAIEAA